MTFNDVVLKVYMPAYKDLYKLSKGMNKQEFANKFYSIVNTLKQENEDHPVGVEIAANCEIILSRVSTLLDRLTRTELDIMLYHLLYVIRIQLVHFCIEYYVLSEAETLRIDDHYSSYVCKRTITNYTDKSYKIQYL